MCDQFHDDWYVPRKHALIWVFAMFWASGFFWSKVPFLIWTFFRMNTTFTPRFTAVNSWGHHSTLFWWRLATLASLRVPFCFNSTWHIQSFFEGQQLSGCVLQTIFRHQTKTNATWLKTVDWRNDLSQPTSLYLFSQMILSNPIDGTVKYLPKCSAQKQFIRACRLQATSYSLIFIWDSLEPLGWQTNAFLLLLNHGNLITTNWFAYHQ